MAVVLSTKFKLKIKFNMENETLNNHETANGIKSDVIGSVSFADALAFAEYFRNQFDFYDCNANGRVYKYIDLRKRGQTAMPMEQIFGEWKAKETDR